MANDHDSDTNITADTQSDTAASTDANEIVASPGIDSSPLPYQDLTAPLPVNPTPPKEARGLAFAGILLGGLLGGMIGYGVGDLLGGSQIWAGIGALLCGVGGAFGVGIVASLTLQAMNEWSTAKHPEDQR